MSEIPHVPGLDNSLKLLHEGYTFISSRCDRYDSDIFRTRLMGSRVYCARGESAARMFYQAGRFTRHGAMPPTTMRLLQDKGSVQPLDGDAHRHRKQMFMAMMTPAQFERLREAACNEWRRAIGRWEHAGEVVLFDAARELLVRVGCAWADVPLSDELERRRISEFSAMLDGAAAFGPKALRGLWLRRRTERWARDMVRRIRAGNVRPTEGSPARLIAEHRGPDGKLLDEPAAAVELINVLRPIVAVGRYIAYAALALHQYPRERMLLQTGDAAARTRFAQEVRRFYPFFPVIGGKVREPFDWHGHRFACGDWVLLDLYGTDHDRRVWKEPDAFRPERFAGGGVNDYNFIPQGGGDVNNGHRCPGEAVTVVLIEVALEMLTAAMDYELPDQDLSVDLSKLPTAPTDRIRIRGVTPRPET